MYTVYYSSRMCFKNIFINTILKITKWYVVLKDVSVCPLLQDAHAEHQRHHGQHPLRDVPRAPAKRVQRSLELSPARASTCSAQGQRSAPTASGRRRASQRSGNPTSSSHSWDVDAHPYARSVYMNRPVDTRVLRARISFPSGTFFPARNNFSIAIIHMRIHSLSFTYNRIWCRDTTGVGGGLVANESIWSRPLTIHTFSMAHANSDVGCAGMSTPADYERDAGGSNVHPR